MGMRMGTHAALAVLKLPEACQTAGKRHQKAPGTVSLQTRERRVTALLVTRNVKGKGDYSPAQVANSCVAELEMCCQCAEDAENTNCGDIAVQWSLSLFRVVPHLMQC